MLRVCLCPSAACSVGAWSTHAVPQCPEAKIRLALLDLQTIQTYRHNPALYVELIGHALLEPFKLDYAPDSIRFGHIIKRLEKVPRLLDQARFNLSDAPLVWIRVARDENAGNFKLIDQVLRARVP